tara:strand:- start:406 stop:813 length:408 start_codon:yes stop_codon:yes gene_type:complete
MFNHLYWLANPLVAKFFRKSRTPSGSSYVSLVELTENSLVFTAVYDQLEGIIDKLDENRDRWKIQEYTRVKNDVLVAASDAFADGRSSDISERVLEVIQSRQDRARPGSSYWNAYHAVHKSGVNAQQDFANLSIH